MFRFSASIIISLLFLVAPPANGQSFASDRQETALYAGLYFSVPFGAQQKSPSKYKLGFKAGPQYNLLSRGGFDAFKQKSFTGNVVDINFSDRGLEEVQLAALPIIRKDLQGKFVYLNDEENKGFNVGKALLITGGVIVGAGILVAISVNNQFDSD
ncbi:hypothetical protein [Kordiimonas laminariae]|uniref:hypothetical protein n=1 Tax=Kordiimonas laminariae TaxID=2917717 RepID=UPI001FF68390|nr:hypothetical protein [Kordiimonas laminariae]MCK0069324.1 hypothetical protein [Kordiimonas laminariae]